MQLLVIIIAFGIIAFGIIAFGRFPTCAGAEINWAEPEPGFWASSFKWSPNQIPGTTDTAVFDTGVFDPADRYAVFLDRNTSVRYLQVHFDKVLFVPNGKRMNVIGSNYGLDVGPNSDNFANLGLLPEATGPIGEVVVYHNARVGGEEGSDGVLFTKIPFSVQGDLVVGDGGNGFFQVDENGNAEVQGDMNLGILGGSFGRTLVFDPNARLDVGGTLRLSEDGESYMNIFDQGIVTANAIELGVSAGSTGELVVQGDGSRMFVSSTTEVGLSGRGIAGVLAGGQLITGGATIGRNEAAGSRVEVADIGSKWTVDGDLVVGAEHIEPNDQGNSVGIFTGGEIDVSGHVEIHRASTLNIREGKLRANSLNIAGLAVLEDRIDAAVSGDGSLFAHHLASLGDANSPNGFDFAGDTMVGFFFEITVGVGTGTQYPAPAQLTVNDADHAVFRGGTTSIVDGSVLDVPNGALIDVDAVWQVQGGPTFNHLPQEVGHYGGVTIHGPVTNRGVVQGPINDNRRFEFEDDFDGDGELKGWVEMRSRVSPGVGGVGALTVEHLDLLETSILSIELGGAEVGTFDQLLASGQVTLAGELHVTLIDDTDGLFFPEPGDQFEVLSAATLLGSFSDTLLPPLAEGLTWNVQQTEHDLTLIVEGATADFQQDGDVDGADFLAWQRGFGISEGASLADGDADGDETVAAADLAIWQTQYAGEIGLITVPEPTSCFLLLSGMVVARFRPRGKISQEFSHC